MNCREIIWLLLITVVAGCENGRSNSSPETSHSSKPPVSIKVSTDTTIKEKVSENLIVEKGKNLEKRNDIEIINKYVTYNDDFEPTLNMKIQNHHDKTVVAIEVEVGFVVDKMNYDYSCAAKIILRKKVNIKPDKTITAQLKIDGVSNSCTPKLTRTFVTEYVLSDGTKLRSGRTLDDILLDN